MQACVSLFSNSDCSEENNDHTNAGVFLYFCAVFIDAINQKIMLTATPSNTSGPHHELWHSTDQSDQDENETQMEESSAEDDNYDNPGSVNARINKNGLTKSHIKEKESSATIVERK